MYDFVYGRTNLYQAFASYNFFRRSGANNKRDMREKVWKKYGKSMERGEQINEKGIVASEKKNIVSVLTRTTST